MKLQRIDGKLWWSDGVAIYAASIDDVIEAHNRLEATVAALVKAWPDDPGVSSEVNGVLYEYGGGWCVQGDDPGEPKPYPTREAAVFAAAGIDPEVKP